mgnify:CR=1 FL=1
MKKEPDPDPHHCTGMNVTLYWLVGLGLSFATGDVGVSDINVRRMYKNVVDPIYMNFDMYNIQGRIQDFLIEDARFHCIMHLILAGAVQSASLPPRY